MSNSQNLSKKTKVLYIIFSIVASIALWIYVAYVDNPSMPQTFYGIKVEFVGKDQLLDNDLIVTNIDTDSLNITFSGRRNTVSKLSNSNVTATVDLAQILSSTAGAGVYQLPYDLNFATSSNGITVSSASKNYITVTVEKLVTVSVPVKVNYDGTIAENYTAELPQAALDKINVSGPQEEVMKIDHALASIDRDNLSKSISEDVALQLIDVDGNVIVNDKFILSTETVAVTMSVLLVKDIKLEVNLVEGASATKANTKCVIEPSSITLSGDPEVLEDINVITLGTVDLTSFVSTFSDDMPITVPNDVNNLSGVTSASVKIEVLNTDSTRLSATNIQLKNVPEGRTASVVTQSLDITLRGPEETLNQVTADNIRIVANLSENNNTTGTFAVNAKVYIDGFSSIDAVGEYKVTVVITQS